VVSRVRRVYRVLSGMGCVAAMATVPVAAAPVGAAPQPAGAADGPRANPAFALMVSPTRLVIRPKDLDDVQRFRVVNRGSRPLEVVTSETNFEVNERGTVVLNPNAPYSAASWIKIAPTAFRLRPHSERRVSVRISPPGVREPGEHQVALVFLVPAGQTAGNLRVNRAIGTPMYIMVPGPIDPTLKVDGLRAAGFALGGPIDFTVRLRSAGTVHRDLFGNDRLTIAAGGRKVPFPDLTIPRGASRTVTVRWAHPPLMCLCHATVAIPGPHGTSRRTITVVIFPAHLAAAGVVALAAAWWTIVVVRRRRVRAAGRADPVRPPDGEVRPPPS
jgi:hypothetical protein